MDAKLKTKSDVPRFLAMLKDYHVPAEYCVGLFSCWCSNEGSAVIAEKCMDIQTKCGIVITAVWEWVCTNDPCPDTDWSEEVDRFKEEIMPATKLTKEELFNKAKERFNSWAKMYGDANVTAEQMYEDMSCSVFSGDVNYDKIANDKPVLDQDFCFSYKGYDFELSSCNNITHGSQIVGITMENIKERFPNGIFLDRYVCWMCGHKDCEGHTKEEVDDPEVFAPMIYLVPDAWSWGADDDLKPGAEVSTFILKAIDKFLDSFKE